ncbi:hypothetical protein EV426DRAFT_699973 [Tirmania nivea]|nr:hypothetical protein EV426DRAFT_699973 [Tirmania nivea]
MSKIAEFPTMSKASTKDRSAILVGIIGMGDMGRVNACDRDDKYEVLKEEYKELPNITILRNGHYMSRASDYIMYSVEAENIEKVVGAYGPSIKLGVIVGGQMSCKAPEMAAFGKHLLEDVEIPPLAAASAANSSTFPPQHDRVTADTQAVTHAAFLSMGSAWHAATGHGGARRPRGTAGARTGGLSRTMSRVSRTGGPRAGGCRGEIQGVHVGEETGL